jgi:hypothetical protein
VAGGFFKSTDGGVTWRENDQLKDQAVHSIAQSESNPDMLIAGTYTTIFRSEDSGETWKQLPTAGFTGLHHVESIAIDPRTANTIYAGTFYLPYKSEDGGKTWRVIKNGMIDDSDIFAIDIDPAIPITSSLPHVAAFTKARTQARAGAKSRAFLLSRAERDPSFSIRLFQASFSPAPLKASGDPTKVATLTRGWLPLRGNLKSTP